MSGTLCVVGFFLCLIFWIAICLFSRKTTSLTSCKIKPCVKILVINSFYIHSNIKIRRNCKKYFKQHFFFQFVNVLLLLIVVVRILKGRTRSRLWWIEGFFLPLPHKWNNFILTRRPDRQLYLWGIIACTECRKHGGKWLISDTGRRNSAAWDALGWSAASYCFYWPLNIMCIMKKTQINGENKGCDLAKVKHFQVPLLSMWKI